MGTPPAVKPLHGGAESSRAASPSCSSADQPSSSQAEPSDELFRPTLAPTSPANYGKINPENEANLSRLNSVTVDAPKPHAWPQFATQQSSTPDINSCSKPMTENEENKSAQGQQLSSEVTSLANIPPELIDTILSFLPARDLASMAATCRSIREQALSDMLWQALVQQDVPGIQVDSLGPCSSFYEIYSALDPYWFLPRHKIWFCDRELTGRLILARYNQHRGCIEGCELLGISISNRYDDWPADSDVVIHGFEPRLGLHKSRPAFLFNARPEDREEEDDGNDYYRLAEQPRPNRFSEEIPMKPVNKRDNMFSTFLFAKPLDPQTADEGLSSTYPYKGVWPPPTIPGRHHVTGMQSGCIPARLPFDRPYQRSEISDQTFRLRRWMELAQHIRLTRPNPGPAIDNLHQGMLRHVRRIGEEVMTFSTLDPSLYTPTETKPWRGIWSGDYSGHGCEILLINQPDDPPATDAELDLVRLPYETDEAWNQRKLDARIYRGRLEAIKLTGDPNVPRGEYTFVADDIGPGGFVRTSSDEPFVGARVVKSKGHVAETRFTGNKFIESHLFIIGPNRLAQHWLEFGHISYFERINIERFLDPENDWEFSEEERLKEARMRDRLGIT